MGKRRNSASGAPGAAGAGSLLLILDTVRACQQTLGELLDMARCNQQAIAEISTALRDDDASAPTERDLDSGEPIPADRDPRAPL